MELLVIFCVVLFFLVVTLLPRTGLNKYLANDGPLFGSFSDRVAWFSARQTDRTRSGKDKVDLISTAYYWECDRWDCHRLWTKEDGKHLALVTNDFTWRVYTAYLMNSHEGYLLVDVDDLLALNIRTFDTAAWTPTIIGQTDSLETAKHQAEVTIGFIRDRLGGEHIDKL